MKASEVYLRAAKELFAEPEPCAAAVYIVPMWQSSERPLERVMRQEFVNLFAPGCDYFDASEDKNFSVLALLLMSEIAKDSE